MNMQAVDRAVTGAYKVDVSRGRRIGEVSRQWFSRPDDEKYLSLPELAERGRDGAAGGPRSA